MAAAQCGPPTAAPPGGGGGSKPPTASYGLSRPFGRRRKGL